MLYFMCMIAYLSGTPKIISNKLIILTNGVGYGVNCTTDLISFANTQESIDLYIYTHVKEDAIDLYGFRTQSEKELFILLISVSGVGPATALNILNKGAEASMQAIQEANISFFTGVKRVGKKAAQKIIIELKSKLGGLADLDLTPLNQIQTDVIDGLVGLGFPEDQAQAVAREMDLENIPLEKAMQQAIKEIGKNK